MKDMKVYTIIAVVVIAAVFGAYRQGGLNAAEETIAPAKIAVVNVTEVIKNSRRFKDWQQAKQQEAQQIEAELQAMREELTALNENLKIRTPGSEDHQKLVKEFIEKRAVLQGKETAYQELWENQKSQWTEKLYQELLGVIDEVATSRGLDLVLANEDLNLADPMRPDIMQIIVTKKLLYHNSKYDITDQVLAALDARD